ncbi:hypothetical protein A0J61_11156, partial [Choanephora cucurbitarum]
MDVDTTATNGISDDSASFSIQDEQPTINVDTVEDPEEEDDQFEIDVSPPFESQFDTATKNSLYDMMRQRLA